MNGQGRGRAPHVRSTPELIQARTGDKTCQKEPHNIFPLFLMDWDYILCIYHPPLLFFYKPVTLLIPELVELQLPH